jgi:hypothetical protein
MFIHTLVVRGKYNNEWANENNLELDPEAWRALQQLTVDQPLFHCAGVQVEDQADVDERLTLPSYRAQGCPWRSSTFEMLDNHVRALYSLSCVTRLATAHGDYDYYVFSRPDTLYTAPFGVEWLRQLDSEDAILLPNFCKDPVNDRFAVCSSRKTATTYGSRFAGAHAYSLFGRLHAERYLLHTLETAGARIKEVAVQFYRVRANGAVMNETDLPVLTPEERAAWLARRKLRA